MKKILYLIILILVLLAFSVPFKSYAADIFFGVNNKEVNLDSKFEVGIFLDTQADNINAIEGTIMFPSNSLEFQEVFTGNSNITFWVQQPALIAKDSVSFSGMIPGGFTGTKGYLFSLIFKATKKGQVTINSNNEKIYLNDGQGSLVDIKEAPLMLDIVEKEGGQNFVPLYDPNPPELFEPQVSWDENIFEGKWFLAFVTQDKGSGIDHYEVMEGGQFGSFASLFSKKQWIVAESPYLLQDQSLESVIYVKAVDKAGNERIVKIKPRYSLLWYENYFVWIIIIVTGTIIMRYKLWEILLKKVGIILFALGIGFLLPDVLYAANLYFLPSSGNYSQGQNFTTSILVNTEQSINAVSGLLNFPTEYLEVIALSTVNSIVNLWVQAPSFSNGGDSGNVNFEGIILNPGYIGSQGKIIDVVFMVKKIGSASLAFSNSAILSNDGKGTNIVSSSGTAKFSFIKSQSPGAKQTSTDLEKKIEEIADKVSAIKKTLSTSPIIVVQNSTLPKGILAVWEVVPNWIKISVFLAIGVATLILLFIVISLGIVILIWFWSLVWNHRIRIAEGIKKFLRKVFAYLGIVKKEVKGDIIYSIEELEKEFQNIRKTPSFKMIWIDYWFAIGRIIKRFFTKNENYNITSKTDDKSRLI